LYFSSIRRHTRSKRDWSSDVCSSDLMQDLTKESKKISPLHLMEDFKSKNIVNDIGGLSYLTKLFDMSPTSSNWEEYAEIIQRNSLRRTIIKKAERLSTDSFNAETDIE